MRSLKAPASFQKEVFDRDLELMLGDVDEDLCECAAAVQAMMEDGGLQLQLDVLRSLQRSHDGHHGLVVTHTPQEEVLAGRHLHSVGPGRSAGLHQVQLEVNVGEAEARSAHGEEVLLAGRRYLHVVRQREVVEGERDRFLAAQLVVRRALALFALASRLVVGVPVVPGWALDHVAPVAATRVQAHLVLAPADVSTLALVNVLAGPLVVAKHVALGTRA